MMQSQFIIIVFWLLNNPKSRYILLSIIFSFFGTIEAFSQCTNTTSYGSVTAPTNGATTTISTVQYATEYATINTVAATTIYQSTSSISTDYLTVRKGTYNGTVIASGTTPLVWTSTGADTYYVHCNTNSSCGTASTSRTTTITHLYTVPSSGSNSFTLCSGNLYDNGGPSLNYDNYEDGVTIIYPSDYSKLSQLSGSVVSEGGYDYITIYDGIGTSGTVLFGGSAHSTGINCVTTAIPTTTSTNGPLTIKFHSDFSNVCAGFTIAVGCSTPTNVTSAYASCNTIYVSTTGKDYYPGTPDYPVFSLTRAINLVSSSRKHIKIAAGSYTEASKINMSEGLIIEGGFVVSGNNWTKSSDAITNITILATNSTITEINDAVRHTIGVSSDNKSNWTLQDLNITTAAVTGTSSSGSGSSNYALWINGCSNYNIIRCNITSGAASAGSTGATGTIGTAGAVGTAGGQPTTRTDAKAGGAGGTGSGTGGAGGTGGASTTSSGSAGSVGIVGGNASDGAIGGARGLAGPGNNNCNAASVGGTGTVGTAGGVGTAATTAVAATYSTYFIPGTGNAGTTGKGGGGGGGAGGAGGAGFNGPPGVSNSVYILGIGSSTQTATIPSTPITTVAHNTHQICKNSEISINKASGTWILPDGINFVNDATSSTSSYNTSSATALVYSTAVSSTYNLTSPLSFYGFIRTTSDDRTAPTITLSSSSFCQGTGSLTLSATSWGTQQGYDWRIFTTDANSPLLSSSVASPVFDISSLAAGTYNIRYRVKESCCGWSCPVYATFQINSLSTAPSSISITNDNTCNGTSKTLSVVGGSLGTGATWKWYTSSCGGTSAGSGTSIVVDPAAGTSTTYYARAEGTCNTTTCASATVTVHSLSTAPTSITGTTSICIGGSTTLSVSGGSLGTGASWKWYSGSCGGTYEGTGTSISVSPSSTTSYYVRAEGTCNTTTCASASVTVNSLPTSTVGVLCNNSVAGKIELNGAGGSGVYSSYEQQSPSVSHASNIFAVPFGATYNFRAIDNRGCKSDWVAYTAPSGPSQISGTATNGSCLVRGDNSWWNITDVSNQVILSINDNTNNLGNISAWAYIEPATTFHSETYYLKRHFKITSENAPSSNVTLRLYFTDSELNELVTNSKLNANHTDDVNGLSDLKITRYSGSNEDGSYANNDFTCGGCFTVYSPASGTASAYGSDVKYLEISVPGFSENWIHGGVNTTSILPVELASFQPQCLDKNALIRWVTASEINNSHFLIERSIDGINYTTINQVPGSGNSNNWIEYSYIDHQKPEGIVYYRLVQVDYNGTQNSFEPVSLNCDVNHQELKVLPNPFKDKISIIGLTNKDVSLEIFNGNGAKVFTNSINNSTSTNMDMSFLKPGIYLLRIIDEQGVVHQFKLIRS